LSGTALSDLETLQSGFRVRAQDHYLPLVDPTVHGPGWKRPLIRFFFTFNLNSGRYELKVDNQIVAIATETEWSMGVQLTKGPEVAQAESLRRAIVDKNQLLFHRLRPQNETYLYLFRKHEQGHMAGEVPQFDPLIAEKEAEIDKLKKPVPHTYELIRVEEKK
jgi:hypothetical protein